ncbi:hypothetical protein CAPTEDRAFT_209468 [Capitella teleta]|uniref:CARD domain-containing protein n=1 Tax=Capitella teleta TaxID=283909 RepID=R7UVP6_CAPTE|nr:hypothetical protein CAPTEDRAFT_209468 [Capitella teleta]|eukprot:ELU07466.1 hypothetical protein CAPTEDRAFT_209468 [Capitella teleta]
MESKMEDRHKECLLKNRSFLCSEMSLSAVLLAKLTESGVITDEHVQKLQNIERNDTTKAAVFEFLSEVLPKRGPEAFDLFLKALCESEQRHVAERLKKCLSDDCSGDAGTFERLQHELRTHYDDKLQFVYPIPWLLTERFSLKETFVQRRLRVTSGARKGNEVKMDEILASVGEGRNKRILVEGDPAQGKSTLCQALAYAWSQPGEVTQNIKSYDLVILLHAGDLKGQSSVTEAIKTHLLPIDCDITSRQLQELLLTKNVLLIIDAFDEASSENEILNQLIEGKLLKHKTMLVTSRPNFLENKLRHFESTFAVEGYDEEEQMEHVKRYAEHKNIDPEPFISMLIESSILDLCNNPLNLTLLCKLAMSRFQAEMTFQFTHKTFLQFLTAKRIAQMDREERLARMQNLLCANYSIKLMRLIGELNDVPPELSHAIVKRCPPYINIYPYCSDSCRRAILKLGNLRLQPPIPVNVNLGLSPNEEEISFVKRLIECKNIERSAIWIKPRDHTELRNMVSELRIGQADSVQQVSINFIFLEGNPCEGLSFGNNLNGLELKWFKQSHSYLLEAALDKPLTSLHLIDYFELDDKCISLMHRLLRNQHLQSVKLMLRLPWEHPCGRLFLADVAQLENLQILEIQLNNSTKKERRSLETILKRNKLIKLTIYSDYSRSLNSVLNDSFHSMSSLCELHLRCANIIDLPNLRHLDLVNFTLQYSKLNDNWIAHLSDVLLSRLSESNDNRIALLSDALRSWRNLEELNIYFDKDVSVAECLLRKLFEAIAGCHRLQILRFEYLEIGDSVVPSVCRMLESLKQLRQFTSRYQRDESLTEEGFKQLEPIIKRNGLNTFVD